MKEKDARKVFAGRLGGLATKRKKGKKHFSKIAKERWKKLTWIE